MRGSVISLLISLCSGFPYVLALGDPKTHEPHGIAMFPSVHFAIGLALVLFVTGPAALSALLLGIRDRKDGHYAIIVVSISSVVLVLVGIVFLKMNGVLR